MNRWVLSAAVTERGSLRFTPAGLPVTDLVLSHESVVTQEGQARKVSVQVKADRKSTRLNSSHVSESRMPSSA